MAIREQLDITVRERTIVCRHHAYLYFKGSLYEFLVGLRYHYPDFWRHIFHRVNNEGPARQVTGMVFQQNFVLCRLAFIEQDICGRERINPGDQFLPTHHRVVGFKNGVPGAIGIQPADAISTYASVVGHAGSEAEHAANSDPEFTVVQPLWLGDPFLVCQIDFLGGKFHHRQLRWGIGNDWQRKILATNTAVGIFSTDA